MTQQAQTVEVPVSLLQGFVGFVEKSGKLLGQMGQDQAQAKEAAAEALSLSHVKTLESLRRTATHVRPYSLGEGETKEASAGDVSEKDQKFIAALGF